MKNINKFELVVSSIYPNENNIIYLYRNIEDIEDQHDNLILINLKTFKTDTKKSYNMFFNEKDSPLAKLTESQFVDYSFENLELVVNTYEIKWPINLYNFF